MVDIVVVGGLVLYEAGIAGLPGVFVVFLTQPLQVRSSTACLVSKLQWFNEYDSYIILT